MPFPGYAAEDQDLLDGLTTFSPSVALLEAEGLAYDGYGTEGMMPLVAAGTMVADAPSAVDPAECQPIISALNLATDEDATARSDDPIVSVVVLYPDGDAGGAGLAASVRARVFDDPAAATAVLDAVAGASGCTGFVQTLVGPPAELTADGVEVSTPIIDGLDGPTARIDLRVVQIVDSETGATQPIDEAETSYYAVVDRVLLRAQVGSDTSNSLAADVLAEVAGHLEGAAA
ncbi:hypothetical protein [Demequina sp.]|uniref:hypothetical protein n=1 Tax=Demequina sp. TaxID=2050685 RepID=UPI0025F99408|nr:hypothetical protein [Demequina sp.]